jgi:hypothetical protein
LRIEGPLKKKNARVFKGVFCTRHSLTKIVTTVLKAAMFIMQRQHVQCQLYEYNHMQAYAFLKMAEDKPKHVGDKM